MIGPHAIAVLEDGTCVDTKDGVEENVSSLAVWDYGFRTDDVGVEIAEFHTNNGEAYVKASSVVDIIDVEELTDGDAGSQGEDNSPFNIDLEQMYLGLDEEIQSLQHKQSLLNEIDELASKIDCDYGAASIETSHGKEIQVSISARDMAPEIRQLVEGYNWSLSRDLDYDSESGCLQWTLRTRISDLYTLQTDDTAKAENADSNSNTA